MFLKLNISYFDFVASFYISSLFAILLFKTMIYVYYLLIIYIYYLLSIYCWAIYYIVVHHLAFSCKN